KAASNLIVGDPRATHPVFMGPIISEASRQAVWAFQSDASRQGGEWLVPSAPIDTPEGGWYLTPSVIRVDRFVIEGSSPGRDEEVFGPLLRISILDSLVEAITQANATRFGLAASIFTRNAGAVEQFLAEARAGCVNANT